MRTLFECVPKDHTKDPHIRLLHRKDNGLYMVETFYHGLGTVPHTDYYKSECTEQFGTLSHALAHLACEVATYEFADFALVPVALG